MKTRLDIEHTIAYKRRDMEMKWDRIRNHLETAINILKPRKKLHITEKKHVMAFTESNPKCYSIDGKEEQSMYSVFDVANWFLNKEPMTHKKLQKICYYAQAWFYALKNVKLANTDFEAWVHGPVSPELYRKYAGSGYQELHVDTNIPSISKQDEELLESVWETYGSYSGNSLEVLSHSELPWKKARIGYEPNENSNVKIDANDMKEYYKSIYTGGEE